MSDILIVEDEQHIADGIRFNLEAEGHSAVVAGNGEAALDLLLREQRTFDAVILDVNCRHAISRGSHDEGGIKTDFEWPRLNLAIPVRAPFWP